MNYTGTGSPGQERHKVISNRPRRLSTDKRSTGRVMHQSISQSPMECSDLQQPTSGTSRQMDSLESQPKERSQQSKLLGSKSLSHLVNRGLFFKKSNKGDDGQQQQQHQLKTTKSFSSGLLRTSETSAKLDSGIVRQSSCNSFGCSNDTFFAMQKPNLSPIVGQAHLINSELFAGSSGPLVGEQRMQSSASAVEERVESTSEPTVTQEGEEDDDKKTKKKAKKQYKPFKNTGLVLRDVKNSLGLRLRAKHDSHSFAKLTCDDGAATPPTKLYSPFNIYTPDGDCKKKQHGKSKKASNDEETKMTPKNRVAMQHKRHLTNKFAFDSPTGRVREGVQDVERFQQCIERISDAIKHRDLL